MLKSVIAAAALLTPALVAAAPGGVTLASTVQVEKTGTVAGKTQTVLAKPDLVVPGDRLVLATRYANTGSAPVTRFVITSPVPKGVSFAGEASAGAQVSVDGGRSFGPLGGLRVAGPQGPRAATPADVNAVRWTVPSIAPGASGSVSYRGQVQ